MTGNGELTNGIETYDSTGSAAPLNSNRHLIAPGTPAEEGKSEGQNGQHNSQGQTPKNGGSEDNIHVRKKSIYWKLWDIYYIIINLLRQEWCSNCYRNGYLNHQNLQENEIYSQKCPDCRYETTFKIINKGCPVCNNCDKNIVDQSKDHYGEYHCSRCGHTWEGEDGQEGIKKEEPKKKLEPMGFPSKGIISAFLLFIIVFLSYLVVASMPSSDQIEGTDEVSDDINYVLGISIHISMEQRIILLVFLTGALGATVFAETMFIKRVGQKEIHQSYFIWYIFQPFIGGGLAALTYWLIRAGLFSPTSGTNDLNIYGFIAVAGLVGFASREAIEMLRKIAKVLFADVPDDEEDLKKKKKKKGEDDDSTSGDRENDEKGNDETDDKPDDGKKNDNPSANKKKTEKDPMVESPGNVTSARDKTDIQDPSSNNHETAYESNSSEHSRSEFTFPG